MGGLAKKLIASAGGEEKLYVDDVFSTYLYTGNGSTQTINNGIDLAGKGGMVWTQPRNYLAANRIYDTIRGAKNLLTINSGNAGQTTAVNSLTAFNSTGFSLGSDTSNNNSGSLFVSWTFRRAAKFFDVVTYTGNGGSMSIAHELGSTPGMVIVKAVTRSENWLVLHRGNGSAHKYGFLNSTAQLWDADGAYFGNGAVYVPPTDNAFTVAGPLTTFGHTYVAYLFAHDPSADGIIQCGSFTTDGSGNATVNLGWEPQFLIDKTSSTTSNWYLFDNMRGTPVGSPAQILFANTSGAEISGTIRCEPNATGFSVANSVASSTHIYLAIRRPNKPPTSGTQVYNAIAGGATAPNGFTTGFPVDMNITLTRDGSSGPDQFFVHDRLRGAKSLFTHSTAAEVTHSYDTAGYFQYDLMDRVGNTLGTNWFNYSFKRAPGVFDVVCYTGTGVARTVNHNLGVTPELMIVKARTTDPASNDWKVYTTSQGIQKESLLNSTSAVLGPYSPGSWGNTLPTSTTFSVSGSGWGVNALGITYVAYLFASLPGISKVGSYTGNGTSQTINCGFTTGSRFILIKRTDSTGDWYVWDSARGIVAANDPHLSLNTTAAEVTTDDSVDPESSGFIVNQNTATNINVNGGSYIFLAIA